MKGTLNFALRTLKGSKDSIQVIHRFGRGNEVRFSTGHFIDSSKVWNEKKQRVKTSSAQKDAFQINQFLDNKSLELTNELKSLFHKNPNYNKKDVKKLFNRVFGKTKKNDSENLNLIDCYHWYIDYFSINPNPTTRKPLSNGTIRSFKTSLRVFKDFSRLKGGLDYEDISMEIYEDFIEYLRNKNFSNNYIFNHIKNLKTILNYSFSRGYHQNTTHKRREFAKPKERVASIYLNTQELKILEKLKLNQSLEISRDLFLIGAYTGLRVSDFNRLSKDNLELIEGKYYFKIETKKTSRSLLIPCHPTIEKIIKKYNYSPPSKKANQNINKDLKIIGKKAELNELVKITKTIGGKVKTITCKKHELLTTHTARRSFCTNAYKAGMPTLDIMTISGHQTEKVFYDYIKASSLERAKRIAEHPFFNQKD